MSPTNHPSAEQHHSETDNTRNTKRARRNFYHGTSFQQWRGKHYRESADDNNHDYNIDTDDNDDIHDNDHDNDDAHDNDDNHDNDDTHDTHDSDHDNDDTHDNDRHVPYGVYTWYVVHVVYICGNNDNHNNERSHDIHVKKFDWWVNMSWTGHKGI